MQELERSWTESRENRGESFVSLLKNRLILLVASDSRGATADGDLLGEDLLVPNPNHSLEDVSNGSGTDDEHGSEFEHEPSS